MATWKTLVIFHHKRASDRHAKGVFCLRLATYLLEKLYLRMQKAKGIFLFTEVTSEIRVLQTYRSSRGHK